MTVAIQTETQRPATRPAEYARVEAESIPGLQPASTGLGVASVAVPGMLIKLDAAALP